MDLGEQVGGRSARRIGECMRPKFAIGDRVTVLGGFLGLAGERRHGPPDYPFRGRVVALRMMRWYWHYEVDAGEEGRGTWSESRLVPASAVDLLAELLS